MGFPPPGPISKHRASCSLEHSYPHAVSSLYNCCPGCFPFRVSRIGLLTKKPPLYGTVLYSSCLHFRVLLPVRVCFLHNNYLHRVKARDPHGFYFLRVFLLSAGDITGSPPSHKLSCMIYTITALFRVLPTESSARLLPVRLPSRSLPPS